MSKTFRPYPKKYLTKSKGKMGNKKQTYNGYAYHSKAEAEYAKQLDWRVKAGEIKTWTRQHKINLISHGQHICKYYIDFRVELASGQIEYHEVKGFQTELWRLKWKLTQAQLHTIEDGSVKLVLIKV